MARDGHICDIFPSTKMVDYTAPVRFSTCNMKTKVIENRKTHKMSQEKKNTKGEEKGNMNKMK